jgi:hypothetical protein
VTNAVAVVALCQSRGLKLTIDGDGLLLEGPRVALDELRALVRHHKPEILALLEAERSPRLPVFTTTTAPRTPKPFPDGPGQEWHRDYLGRWVNLWGLRPQGGRQ